MLEYDFTIYGNHQSKRGNPVPYTRTLRHAWRQDASRYMGWQEYVRKVFLDQNKNIDTKAMWKYGKPIKLKPGQTAQMHLVIWWATKKHGDPDNIFKGIVDALFVDDREVYGGFVLGGYDKHNPRVDVKIIIN